METEAELEDRNQSFGRPEIRVLEMGRRIFWRLAE
jgi:hypothetical protein